MSFRYLQLLKFPVNNTEYSLPYTPKAYIAVKASSIVKAGKGEFPTISAECRTPREVEEAADELIKELRAIKKLAKSFFEKEKIDS